MNIATGAMKAISTTISGASSLSPFSTNHKASSQDKTRPKYKKGSGIHDNEEVSAALSIQRWYRKSKVTGKKDKQCCGKFCSKFCCCCPCHKSRPIAQSRVSQQYVVKHDKGAPTLLQLAKDKQKIETPAIKERPTTIRSERTLSAGSDEKPNKSNRLSPMAQRDVSPILDTLRNYEYKEKHYDSPLSSPLSNRGGSSRNSPLLKSPASESTHLLKNK